MTFLFDPTAHGTKMMTKFLKTVIAALLLVGLSSLVGAGNVYATSASPDSVSVIDDPAVQPVSPEGPDLTAPPAGQAVVPADNISPVANDVIPVVPDAAVPSDDSLATPAPSAEAPSSLNTPDAGIASGGNPLGDTGAQSQHSGQYYDSTALVPDSQLEDAGVTGPRKVDPLYEPGQKYITVERGAGPTSFEGQFVAATRALKLGRYAAAMEMFEKLYKKNHKDQRVLMGLAVAQQGAGFVESAARTYEELLSIDPDNADAVVNLMGIMKSQYPAVTLQNLMDLRGKFPTNPGIPAQIGLVNAEMQNYDDAIRYLEVAASMDPTNANHIYNIAIIADRKGDVKGAMKFYQRALELDAAYSDNASSLPREQIYDRLSTLRQKA